MKIRKAKLKDVTKIVNLWKEFMKNHDELVIKVDKKQKPYTEKKTDASSKFKKFIEKNIRSRNGIIYISEVDRRLVGYLLAYIKENIPIFKIDKLGYISDLFVKKEFRGLGVSSKLKEEVFKWFKKKKVKYASISADSRNKYAHSIYKKWSFVDYHIEMRRKL